MILVKFLWEEMGFTLLRTGSREFDGRAQTILSVARCSVRNWPSMRVAFVSKLGVNKAAL